MNGVFLKWLLLLFICFCKRFNFLLSINPSRGVGKNLPGWKRSWMIEAVEICGWIKAKFFLRSIWNVPPQLWLVPEAVVLHFAFHIREIHTEFSLSLKPLSSVNADITKNRYIWKYASELFFLSFFAYPLAIHYQIDWSDFGGDWSWGRTSPLSFIIWNLRAKSLLYFLLVIRIGILGITC